MYVWEFQKRYQKWSYTRAQPARWKTRPQPFQKLDCSGKELGARHTRYCYQLYCVAPCMIRFSFQRNIIAILRLYMRKTLCFFSTSCKSVPLSLCIHRSACFLCSTPEYAKKKTHTHTHTHFFNFNVSVFFLFNRTWFVFNCVLQLLNLRSSLLICALSFLVLFIICNLYLSCFKLD